MWRHCPTLQERLALFSKSSRDQTCAGARLRIFCTTIKLFIRGSNILNRFKTIRLVRREDSFDSSKRILNRDQIDPQSQHRPLKQSNLQNTTDQSSSAAGRRKRRMKRKILCLHGGQQSGEIMKQKIASSRKKLGKYFDLYFLDAPYECKIQQEEQDR